MLDCQRQFPSILHRSLHLEDCEFNTFENDRNCEFIFCFFGIFRFLTGPPDLADATNLGKIPLVTVRDEKALSCDGSVSSTSEGLIEKADDIGDYGSEHQLIVYRAKEATMCFLFEGKNI